MPTLTIYAANGAEEVRDKIARDATVALAGIGIDPRRLLVLFLPAVAYFGPMPAPQRTLWVSLECDADRPASWRDQALEALARALGPFADQDALFLRIIPVDPRDHWNHLLAAERSPK